MTTGGIWLHEMILACKRSGESLCQGGKPGDVWTPEGRHATVREIASLQEYVTQPNDQEVTGAFVVVGAGNGGFRGRELVKTQGMNEKVADRIGLTGTIMNAMVVAADLEEAGVPHKLMLAKGLKYHMPAMNELIEATPRSLRRAFAVGRVVIVAGGSGVLNQSTDSAVLDHAVAYRNVCREPVRVFKATKYGGVYDGDPHEAIMGGQDLPPRLTQVSAATMRKCGWLAVDEPCLDAIESHQVPMFLHGLHTPIPEILAGNGTLVVPEADADTMYARAA